MQLTIARLREQVGALVATDDDDSSAGTPTGMPGLKLAEAPVRDKRPRRKPPHSAGRHRMAPTAQVVHALERCPARGAPLAGGTIKRGREVIELLAPTIVVVEHVYVERCCPGCGKRCVPSPELTEIATGHSRLRNRMPLFQRLWAGDDAAGLLADWMRDELVWTWRAWKDRRCGGAVLPNRWGIERTFAWMRGMCRRLSAHDEHLLTPAMAMVGLVLHRLASTP